MDRDRGLDRSQGSVFTKSWLADCLLTLAGYSPKKDLALETLIEPACGAGAFVAPAASRLAQSCEVFGRELSACESAITAFDLDMLAVDQARQRVVEQLLKQGVRRKLAEELAHVWIRHEDYLLADRRVCDYFVGNPPYVRYERVDAAAMIEYRERWSCMRARADLYVGFLQAGLESLSDHGRLSVVSPDRWMRNMYGSGLRELILGGFRAELVATIHTSDAFDRRVQAYPSLFVASRGEQEEVLVADMSQFGANDARALVSAMAEGRPRSDKEGRWARLPATYVRSSIWPAGSAAELAWLTDLEERLPAITDTGIEMGVGLATGADDAFLVDGNPASTPPAGVEPERLMPVVRARDLRMLSETGPSTWLVNPWAEDGRLVQLEAWESAARQWRRYEPLLRNRHIGRAKPDQWWRTIDKPRADLLLKPKLLIPDLSARIEPFLDRGTVYPLHSVYWITSSEWDLEVLGGLLLSDQASAMVASYSVRMGSGRMRVSAQYLSRIRLPRFGDISVADRSALRDAFAVRDATQASSVADRLLRAVNLSSLQ